MIIEQRHYPSYYSVETSKIFIEQCNYNFRKEIHFFCFTGMQYIEPHTLFTVAIFKVRPKLQYHDSN